MSIGIAKAQKQKIPVFGETMSLIYQRVKQCFEGFTADSPRRVIS